jgi:hypothetical protein
MERSAWQEIRWNQVPPSTVRQEILEGLGLVVLRIDTEIIEKNLNMALELIGKSTLKIKQNTSFPFMGEGWGGRA